MAKSRNRKVSNFLATSWKNMGSKKPILMSLLILTVLTGGALGQWSGVFSMTQKSQLKSGELVPTSLNAPIYTKEYIYNGAQLIATDERCFTLSASSQSFAESSGPSGTASSSAFTITASCSWTATSNDSFISITSGASGTGNGTVNFTVQNNATTSIRSGTITVASGAASQNFTIYQGIAYADVARTDTFYKEIGKLSARGMAISCATPGNFCPNQNLTREEMAFLLIRALHEPSYVPPTPATQRFTDVSSSNAYYNYIDEIAVRQITLGCTTTTYCPGDPVLRQTMAAFLIRSLHEPGYVSPTPGSQRFTDVPSSNPFYAYIDEMAVRAITLGCTSTTVYCPTDPVNRGQMAAFLCRAFNF